MLFLVTYTCTCVYVGTSISIGILINNSIIPMLYTTAIPLKVNILAKLQEATPLKKKLDEFGTFLAKVADHGSLNKLSGFFSFPKPKSSVKFMDEVRHGSQGKNENFRMWQHEFKFLV
jgi:hypothetical protein